MPPAVTPARVRFAPSPTGTTHLGSARTCLYNYLLARQTGGQFILRIEDTDRKRYVPGSEQELMASLRWLGLEWEEGPDIGGPHAPYVQSKRKEIYLQHALDLIQRGLAYYCFCSPQRLDKMRQEQQRRKELPIYDGTCRKLSPSEAAARVAAGESHVIRFKMPRDGSVTAHDRLRGDITVENRTLDDYIIVKSDGLALYHLAAMVDDHLMGITHVLRSAEWLPTFPLHVHIVRAFGWQEPEWVHLSLFLKPSGKGKMSKRDTDALKQSGYSIFVEDLRASGYLPEAVLNWVALMGWSYDDRTEFFTLPDLVEKFSLDKLNASPAAMNYSKLDHFNGLHIRSLAADDLARRAKPFLQSAGLSVADQKLAQVVPIIQERIVTLDDIVPMAGFFFQESVSPNPQDLVGKNMSPVESVEAARRAYQLLSSLPEISHETAEEPLRLLADELGLKAGQLFGILRVAVTGQPVSPPLFESMHIIGKASVLERLQNAITILAGLPAENPDSLSQ
ncbi:MAG TPA: glutamate--tRNA ligase [Anaerolineales bacterium]|nr:glutamate--tRNA ligase [Anaerolineales bacterium]